MIKIARQQRKTIQQTHSTQKQKLRAASRYSTTLENGNSQKSLTEKNFADRIKKAQYAIRGALALRGGQIKAALNEGRGDEFKFKKLIPLNIGNPQAIGQKSLKFNREVLSTIMHPDLLNESLISQDARQRANFILSQLTNPIGAYSSDSRGDPFIRKSVAQYIQERDGSEVESDWQNIHMSNGAGEGAKRGLELCLGHEHDGVLVPIPQYPLYSALLTLNKATLVNYYLDESKNWGLNAEEIERSIRLAKQFDVSIKSIVIINPGNPTGNVLKRSDIEDIIKIAYENKLLIIADEVYQHNLYYPDYPFYSVRKVLAEIGYPYTNSVELISLNSISKGFQGECGLRGGYYEIHNFDKFANEMTYKLKSIELASNTIGQIATHLMVDPPKEGRESTECIEQYKKEHDSIRVGLKERASLLEEKLNEMDNIECSIIQGAMYAFPKIHFSKKALAAAKKLNTPVDSMYCMDMLNETGIVTVPGSGFGQQPGTYHFRLTNIVTPTDEMRDTLERLSVFNTQFHNKYD